MSTLPPLIHTIHDSIMVEIPDENVGAYLEHYDRVMQDFVRRVMRSQVMRLTQPPGSYEVNYDGDRVC